MGNSVQTLWLTAQRAAYKSYVGVQTPGKFHALHRCFVPFLPRGVSDREAEGDLDSVGGLTWKRGGKQTFIVTPYRPYGARIDSTFLV